MASSEQYGFVFAVSFILLFSALVAAIPADFQGQGATNTPVITPIDPSVLTDFAESEPFDTTDFTPWLTVEIYEYLLPDPNGREWICGTDGTKFDLSAKIYFLGLVWLGALDPIRFITLNGTDSSYSITFDEIETEASDGTAIFNLIFGNTGDAAGQYIIYWNTTTYGTNSTDAWENDELYFLHGVGFSAEIDVVNLLIQLLFLQLPEVPLLINVLLIIPVWASIIYVLWFLIISMIPFLGP